MPRKKKEKDDEELINSYFPLEQKRYSLVVSCYITADKKITSIPRNIEISYRDEKKPKSPAVTINCPVIFQTTNTLAELEKDFRRIISGLINSASTTFERT